MAPKWNDEEKQWVGAGLCVAWMKNERCKRGRKCAYKHLTCHNIFTLKECDLYQTCIIKRIEQKRLLLQSQLQAEPETHAEADSGWNSLPCHLCSEIISIIAGTRDKHSFQSLIQAGSILREQASAFIKRLEIRSPLNSFDFLPRLAKPTNLVIRSSAQMVEDDNSRNNGRKIVHVLPKQLRETMTSERLAYLSHVEQVTVEVNERSDRDIIVDLDSFLNPLKLICPSVKDLVLSGSDSITLTDDFLLCGWGDDLENGGIQSLTIEHSEICVSDREDGLYELRDYLDVFESLSSLYLPAQTMYLDDLQSLAALKSLKKLCVSSFHFEDSDKVPDQLFDGVAAPWTELQLCHNGIELSQLSLLPLSLDIHLILKTSPSTTFYWKMTQHDPEEGFDIFIGKQTIDSVVKLLSRASFFSVHGRPRYDDAEPYVRRHLSSISAFIESPKIPHLNLRTSSDMSTEDPADFLDMMAALSPLGLSCGLTQLTILCVPLLPSFFDSFVLSLPFIEVLTIHADANGEAVIEDPFPPLKAHPSLREFNLNEDLSGETLLSVGLQNFRLSVPHMMVSDAGR